MNSSSTLKKPICMFAKKQSFVGFVLYSVVYFAQNTFKIKSIGVYEILCELLA